MRRALHVREAGDAPSAGVSSVGVPVQLLDSDPVESLIETFADPVCGVIGAGAGEIVASAAARDLDSIVTPNGFAVTVAVGEVGAASEGPG